MDDYVDLPDTLNPSVGDYSRTITMWVKIPPQPLGTYNYHNDIIRAGSGWSISTTSGYNNNGGRLVIFAYGYNSGNTWQVITISGILNRDAFLAVTWEHDPSTSTSTVKVYIDGNLDIEATKTGVSFDETKFTNLRLGTGAGGYIKADYIDEVQIFNRALTEQEIKNLHNLKLSPGDNCYGKILNYNCKIGDKLKIQIPWGASKEVPISGCSS